MQFTDLLARLTEFLDFTSLALDEFQYLVPLVEAAFQTHMAVWWLDEKPRIARRFAMHQNCLLPSSEDRLLFVQAYVKTCSLNVVQGRLFHLEQSKAKQWIHVLLAMLLAVLRIPGNAPVHFLNALAQRLGIAYIRPLGSRWFNRPQLK